MVNDRFIMMAAVIVAGMVAAGTSDAVGGITPTREAKGGRKCLLSGSHLELLPRHTVPVWYQTGHGNAPDRNRFKWILINRLSPFRSPD